MRHQYELNKHDVTWQSTYISQKSEVWLYQWLKPKHMHIHTQPVKSNKLDKQKYYNELHHMRETCSSLQSLPVCLCLLSICRSDFLSFRHSISLLLSDVTKSERTDNLLSHGQYDWTEEIPAKSQINTRRLRKKAINQSVNQMKVISVWVD